jgi:hypothetical protein
MAPWCIAKHAGLRKRPRFRFSKFLFCEILNSVEGKDSSDEMINALQYMLLDSVPSYEINHIYTLSTAI